MQAEAVLELLLLAIGVALIVWGEELFTEHLAGASARLGVRAFALGVLLGVADGASTGPKASSSSLGMWCSPALPSRSKGQLLPGLRCSA